MNWFETFRTGFESVSSHRLRSALTVLGILIGITAVILTVGLGQGAQVQVNSEIEALGTNVLTVTPGSSTSADGIRGGFGTASTLTLQDADALESKTVAPDIKALAPVYSEDESLTAGTSNWTTSVVGTMPSWLEVRSRSMAEGRFIDQQDVDDHTAVVVLGSTTASELFTRGDPLGQTVDVSGVPMTVIGVLNTVGSSSSSTASSDPDDQAIVPFSTAVERVFSSADRDSVTSILLEAQSGSALTAAYQEANQELLELHGITDAADPDFTIATETETLGTSNSVSSTLTYLLDGIAAISLLVGGIGIMNIMLVTVTERIREIGLRKALGATPRLIGKQFVLEASLLGLAGGALGAVLGEVGAIYLPKWTGYPISVSLQWTATALGAATVIGLLAGVVPALRAAQLAPIDALRSD